MTTERIITIVTMLIMLIVLAFFLGQCTKQCPKPGNTTITKIDTFYVYSQLPADTIFVSRPRVIIRDNWLVDTLWAEDLHDTVFTALDEFITAKKDTIRTSFFFPEVMFSHYIGYHPDSIKTVIQTITVDRVTEKEIPWWLKPLYVGVGFAGGYLIGRVTK